jgi:hypothetical protein
LLINLLYLLERVPNFEQNVSFFDPD